MGAFTQTGRTFGVVTNAGDDLLAPSTSGILGLAWSSLAETGTPFWETLAENGELSTAEFGFFLARYQDDENASADETSGGEFTLG